VAEPGLPTSLAESGLSAAQLSEYLVMVPDELREIVPGAY
jgi:hypothetical protein